MDRPFNCKCVINQEAETCHWEDAEGNVYPATEKENAEVRKQLLAMREQGSALVAKRNRERR